jgi:hypothetical protein
MKNLSLTLFSIFLYSSLFAQLSIELKPSIDIQIGHHVNFNNSNNGFSSAIRNSCYSVTDPNGNLNESRSILKFDLSSLPNDAIIDSALLNLYASGGVGVLPNGHAGANSSYIKRVITNWNPSQVVWATLPLSTNLNEVILPQSTNGQQDYLNINVTSHMRYFHENPNLNYGIMLGLINEIPQCGLLFASNEFSDSTKHPSLKIYYSITTALNNLNSSNYSFSVMPNPSNGNAVVGFSSIKSEVVKLQVSTILGETVGEVQQQSSSKFQNISLESIVNKPLSKGTYFIKIIGTNFTSTKKIVINE